MWDIALQIAFAHLAASLIPGQSLALVTAGIASTGVAGGLRAMAGITAAKSLWALGTLALLPVVLSADPRAFAVIQIAGGAVLAIVGLGKLLSAHRSASSGNAAILRQSFAGTLVNPTTCVFFLSAFPLLAKPLPAQSPSFGLFCLAAIAVSTILALLPWFAIGLAARRISPQALRAASGIILVAVGATLVAGTIG